MSLLSIFRRPRSATVARERLQLLLAHERTGSDGCPALLEILQSEILQIIAKHVVVDSEKIKISLERQEGIACLEIDIEIRTPLNVLSSQDAASKAA